MSYDKRYQIKRLPENEGIHIPDKKESKTLRNIMSETGLSEKEIREIPKYKRLGWVTIFLYLLIGIPLTYLAYKIMPQLSGISIFLSAITALVIAPKILTKIKF